MTPKVFDRVCIALFRDKCCSVLLKIIENNVMLQLRGPKQDKVSEPLFRECEMSAHNCCCVTAVAGVCYRSEPLVSRQISTSIQL